MELWYVLDYFRLRSNHKEAVANTVCIKGEVFWLPEPLSASPEELYSKKNQGEDREPYLVQSNFYYTMWGIFILGITERRSHAT